MKCNYLKKDALCARPFKLSINCTAINAHKVISISYFRVSFAASIPFAHSSPSVRSPVHISLASSFACSHCDQVNILLGFLVSFFSPVDLINYLFYLNIIRESQMRPIYLLKTDALRLKTTYLFFYQFKRPTARHRGTALAQFPFFAHIEWYISIAP